MNTWQLHKRLYYNSINTSTPIVSDTLNYNNASLGLQTTLHPCNMSWGQQTNQIL